MSKLFLLSKAQMSRLKPYFPLAHGAPRVAVRVKLVVASSSRGLPIFVS